MSGIEPSEPVPFVDGGPIGTIYDVLRKLIEDSPWSEDERRRASELIRDLERFNIFGTVAHNLTIKEER